MTEMKRYCVGIDLGTSNTVLAYADATQAGSAADGATPIRVFEIEQLVSPGEVAARPLLPSVRYHAAPGELSAGDLQLPWSGTHEAASEANQATKAAKAAGGAGTAAAARTAGDAASRAGQASQPGDGAVVVGRLARMLGAQVPGRLVASAKSWLSHASVDRTAPILPWGAPDDVRKVSPVDASASYLAHVRAAWNQRFPDAPLERQDVVLTVPASFDEGARALTVEAARLAGLPSLRLLEEPQAAFYDWLFQHRGRLASELAQTRLVLICDVGGGTTDLTLIEVGMRDGEPQLTRIGVGNHLMLGGDNMDLALAHLVEARLPGVGGGAGADRDAGSAEPGAPDAARPTPGTPDRRNRLSAASLSQLVERCRGAKEQLLGPRGSASRTGAGGNRGSAADSDAGSDAGSAVGSTGGSTAESGANSIATPDAGSSARANAASEPAPDAAPDPAPDSVPVTLLGAGSKLIGGARTVQLTRADVERVIVDGFFPAVASDERPGRARGAIVEFGLPYASDAAITRHVAAFLSRFAAQSRKALGDDGGVDASADTAGHAGVDASAHAAGNTQRADAALPVPDTLLLNGGVFRAEALSRRLADTLGAWRGAPLNVLHNDNPDVAVARGAVAYSLARAGHAPKIGGGSPRSYFLVLDDSGSEERSEERSDKRSDKRSDASTPPASPRGICLLPRGTEEGREILIDDRTFALRLGAPVRFHLVSSSADTVYRPGELVDLAGGDFIRLPPIATIVEPRGGRSARETLVRIATSLTEVGTLDVHCIELDDPSQRWLLEFQLRREDAQVNLPGDAAAARHPALDAALEQIDRCFGSRAQNVAPKEVKRLRAQLEQLLGPRDGWSSALLRELFGALWERARRRRRSADHERLWLNLAGYCVRPGFGYPLDEWRVEQLWSLFDDGIQYVHDSQVWSEWWTLWRRAAGGLDEDAQLRVLDAMEYLQTAAQARHKLPFDIAKTGIADMVRLSASLERIPVERKVALGESVLARLRKPGENHQSWWAVGRIGARRPFYGSAHSVVPPEIAAQWLDALLALDWKKVDPAAFAAVQIARMTGDRSRDLPDALRETVARRLEAAHAPLAWISMVRESVELDDADEGRVFGESLPVGLKLVGA